LAQGPLAGTTKIESSFELAVLFDRPAPILSFESRQVDLGEPTVLTRALIDFETAYVHIGRSTT
jgi:hypothetical protein